MKQSKETCICADGSNADFVFKMAQGADASRRLPA